MHWLTAAFLFFLLAGASFRVWLALRQIRNVQAHRDRVPVPFDQEISLEEHSKAAAYTAARTRLGIFAGIWDTALMLLWTLGGGLALVDIFWRQWDLPMLWTGVVFILATFIVMSILSLPFSIYQTFVVEARFGFNRTTLRLFVTDMVKALALSLIIGGPLLALILWLMARAGDYWWVYAWVAWVTFSLAMTWAFPRFISPLFNKFAPLEDKDLKTRIETLLKRCGFKSEGIFVMDGSRRSSHGNAYFTGMGNNKRIVFFDTLMESLEPGEVEAVLAHELGHFRKNHIRKRLLLSFAMSLVGLAILGWLKSQAWFYSALGMDVASDHAALMLFLLVVPVFTFPVTPLGAYLSRLHEFEADEYASEQSDASSLISALVKLYKDNATTLTPDPLHSGFYDSHPPAPVRVARLAELAKG